MKQILLKCWNGEERLWKVYWIYGILLGMITFAFIGNALVFWLALTTKVYFPIVIYNIFMASYFVWNNVSIWRCSKNAKWPGWLVVARALVIVGAIIFLFSFLNDRSLISINISLPV